MACYYLLGVFHNTYSHCNENQKYTCQEIQNNYDKIQSLHFRWVIIRIPKVEFFINNFTFFFLKPYQLPIRCMIAYWLLLEVASLLIQLLVPSAAFVKWFFSSPWCYSPTISWIKVFTIIKIEKFNHHAAV